MPFFRDKVPLAERMREVERLIGNWASLPHDPARAAHLLGGDAVVEEARELIERQRNEIREHTALIDELRTALARTLKERDEANQDAKEKLELAIAATRARDEAHARHTLLQAERDDAVARQRRLSEERQRVWERNDQLTEVMKAAHAVVAKLDLLARHGIAMGDFLAEERQLRRALHAVDKEEQGRPAGSSITLFVEAQRAFSSVTFGPGRRTRGIVEHIRKELEEVLAAPDDLREWVDVAILALDGAWRAGHEPAAVAEALWAKLARNKARSWPAPKGEDEPVEHVRSRACEVCHRPEDLHPLQEQEHGVVCLGTFR